MSDYSHVLIIDKQVYDKVEVQKYKDEGRDKIYEPLFMSKLKLMTYEDYDYRQ